VVSFTPLPLYTWGKSPRFSLCRRLGGPKCRSGRHGEDILLDPLGIQTPTPRFSSPHTVCIPTALSRNELVRKLNEVCHCRSICCEFFKRRFFEGITRFCVLLRRWYVACDVSIGLCVSTLLDLLSVSLLHYIRFSSLSGLLPSSNPLSHCTANYKSPLLIRAWFNNP
jgi:hypothetical protein